MADNVKAYVRRYTSKVKGVIQTIDRTTIEQTFGTLSDNDFSNLKDCIRTMLCLDI